MCEVSLKLKFYSLKYSIRKSISHKTDLKKKKENQQRFIYLVNLKINKSQLILFQVITVKEIA